jgi:hypothetical protein
MTAGLTSQPMTKTKVALAPIALVGLLGAALLAGGMLGATVASELGSLSANGRIAQVNATASSLESRALVQFRAGERESAARDAAAAASLVSQAPIKVRAGERESAAKGVPPHAQDHIGLTERLFPILVSHAVGHGPLADGGA